MKNKIPSSLFKFSLLLFLMVLNSCSSSSDDYVAVETSPVILNLAEVPYSKLSDYKFFEGDIKNLQPAYGVLPYKPTSELFSEYAKKSRFVWMPNGTKATYTSDAEVLNLPVGAALIKTFYYNNVQPANATKIIETRVMIRKSTGWIFAEYVWNEDQTDALLQMTGSTVSISWLDENNAPQQVDYKIPAANDCRMCHDVSAESKPIGIKPQNLNSNYNYTSGTKNQLSKWVEFGYLENNLPATIVSIVDYKDTSKSLDLRVRSYFDINCAHCHQNGGNADFTTIRMAFSETANPTNMGVCIGGLQVPGITHGYIVTPQDTSQSTLFYMMNTTNPGFRMPRVGRTIVHQEGVQLIEQWINSLPICN
ncbi:hypothetical protein [Flavobacterium sp.]|uniref:hypothetical protein n=1 Tax=Flavobacterium sp. TaxID=239 RepID=UPI00286D5B69|nr:hypothetical protein [Flavobacterium sp.]